MTTAARSQIRDPIGFAKTQSWLPVEMVLVVIILSGLALAPWMLGAYTPSKTGAERIEPGMSQQEVIVILGEPNERLAQDVCWNYGQKRDGDDRICIRFDGRKRVAEVSR